MKRILAIVLIFALIIGTMIVTVMADDELPTVTYDHAKGKFLFSNVSPFEDDDGHQYPDLFPNMKNLMPGDTVTQKIKARVSNIGNGVVNMYLKTQIEGDDITENEVMDYTKLLSQEGVTLTIKAGNRVLSQENLAQKVRIGTFTSNNSLDLDVSLEIPVTAGNDIQSLQGAIQWVFTAEYIASEPPQADTEIPEEPVPGDELPELDKGDHYAYIIGSDDGLVHPEDSITRGETAAIFFRLLTEESRNKFWSKNNNFSDVNSTDWYNNAVSTLYKSGIVKGTPEGKYNPNAPITRAEFAAIAVRFFGGEYEGEDLFSDISGHWACNDINKAAMNGLVYGDTDGAFKPDNNILRCEAIAIINRALEREPVKDHLLQDMKVWKDNSNDSSWYYADVQEATNSHNYKKVIDSNEGTTYEIWTELCPIRDWASLEREWSSTNSSDNPGDVISSENNSTFE